MFKATERTQLAGLKYGVAGGIPQLNAETKIPLGYLYAAEANGLATLGADGYIPASQLNLTAAQVAETDSRLWMTADERTGLAELLQKNGSWQTITVTTADWPDDAVTGTTTLDISLPGDTGLIALNFGTQRRLWGYLIGGVFAGQYVASGSSGGTYSYPIQIGNTISTYRGEITVSGSTLSIVYSSACTGSIYFLTL